MCGVTRLEKIYRGAPFASIRKSSPAPRQGGGMILILSRSIRLCVLVLLACGLLADGAFASWSSDPSQNVPVVVRSGDQAVTKIAATPDGGCYVAWFDNGSGNYDVYLQRLDINGDPQFAPNGMLVSNHTQSSSLVDWDLISDSSGNAVVVFTDVRAGSDLDVYAYRISPAGAFLWGPDGVTLSADTVFEASPRVVETSDGQFVFVWARLPDTGVGAIVIQKLDAAGNPQLGPSGITIPGGGTNERPAFCDVVAADSGGFIVLWVRDIRTFTSPRHLRAQKFSSAGLPLWGANPVIVYDAASVPIAYYPLILSDGNGGAIFGWYRSLGNLFSVFTQHVSSAGVELYPHNGVEASTTAGVHKISPAMVYLPPTGDTLLFWTEENFNQNQWGIVGQKISSSGQRLWTDSGHTFRPVDSTQEGLPRAVPYGDGAMVFFFDFPTMSVIDARVVGIRVDGSGNLVWPTNPVVLSSTLAGKDKLGVDISGRQAVLAWDDERSDSGDVYAQNVIGKGAIGLSAPDEVSPPHALYPLRFLNATTLDWEPGPYSGSDSFNLYRGDLASLAPGAYGSCLANGAPSHGSTDGAIPGPDQGYFYIAVGRNPAGEGPLGSDSAGSPRVPSPGCP